MLVRLEGFDMNALRGRPFCGPTALANLVRVTAGVPNAHFRSIASGCPRDLVSVT